MCDAFYAHNFNMYPIIRPESMEYHLPSDTSAFEAASHKRWKRFVGRDMSLFDRFFTFRRSATRVTVPLSAFGMHALSASIWIRQSELRQRYLTNTSTNDDAVVFESCKFQAGDPDVKAVGILLLQFYSAIQNATQPANPNFSASWNNLCMSLTADHQLFEIAAGRAGPEMAQAAVEKIEIWSRTAAARRACLHAAQTFAVMSQRRTSDGTTFHSEMALFAAALVLGLYVSAMPIGGTHGKNTMHGEEQEPCELLDDVDWRAVGGEGLPFTFADDDTQQSETMMDNLECAARDFIRHGNCISFGGKTHLGGFDAARRIYLEYVGLLEDVGRWNVRRYCHILRSMSDMVLDSASFKT
jgi:hypothetical protein